ncbi:hypothetical protein [Novosphingobium rosa]|uniref:hypothetical protein n=1 Tax=Novosphingobium rosa TaxID=76978 RepID=UPI00082E9961|nr:hypothetical protein [Novosphingobium rosa]
MINVLLEVLLGTCALAGFLGAVIGLLCWQLSVDQAALLAAALTFLIEVMVFLHVGHYHGGPPQDDVTLIVSVFGAGVFSFPIGFPLANTVASAFRRPR